MKRLILLAPVLSAAMVLVGCSGDAATESSNNSDKAETPASNEEDTGPPVETRQQPITTEAELKAALKAANPSFMGRLAVGPGPEFITKVHISDPGIEDVSPLKGMPLDMLNLDGCHITDISALEGMPLEILYLGQTGVRDIRVLEGMPLGDLALDHTRVEDLRPLKAAAGLQKLNLIGSRVSDLTPLAGLPQLNSLWLTGCPVSDIGPLKNVSSLVSLTIAETKVSDLSPLKDHPLQRLHIAKSEVTDLSVLKTMHLTRLIFTPERIKTGIEIVREMPTIEELDTEFPAPSGRRPLPPAMFWQLYDAGRLK